MHITQPAVSCYWRIPSLYKLISSRVVFQIPFTARRNLSNLISLYPAFQFVMQACWEANKEKLVITFSVLRVTYSMIQKNTTTPSCFRASSSVKSVFQIFILIHKFNLWLNYNHVKNYCSGLNTARDIEHFPLEGGRIFFGSYCTCLEQPRRHRWRTNGGLSLSSCWNRSRIVVPYCQHQWCASSQHGDGKIDCNWIVTSTSADRWHMKNYTPEL